MDRSEEQLLEIPKRDLQALPLLRSHRFGPQPRLQIDLEAFAEFPGRLPREGDGRDLLHGRGARADELDHAPQQRRRLTRPGTCLHQNICIQIRTDAISSRPVRKRSRGIVHHRSFSQARIFFRPAYSATLSILRRPHSAIGDVASHSASDTRHTLLKSQTRQSSASSVGRKRPAPT